MLTSLLALSLGCPPTQPAPEESVDPSEDDGVGRLVFLETGEQSLSLQIFHTMVDLQG